MNSYFAFRYHRALRRLRRRLRTWRRDSQLYLHRHVYGGWRKLLYSGWQFHLALLVFVICIVGVVWQIRALDGIYLVRQPITGGVYSEGLLGSVKLMNPLLIDSSAEADVDKLVFAGLTQYDGNGRIVPDLAQSWDISADAKTYTFHLRPGLLWQDAEPLTAADVRFTVDLIQNPDTRSSSADNWKGVKTEVLDGRSVRFTLPASYPNFLAATTIGLLPQHVLGNTAADKLRLSPFNSQPVGAGPFAFDRYDAATSAVQLTANPHYYAGRPRLDSVQLYLFSTDKARLTAYARKQIMALGGIEPDDFVTAHKFPKINLRQLEQPAYTALFFNTARPALADASLRRALGEAIDRTALVNLSAGEHGQARIQTLPLLTGQLGLKYQSSLAYDPAAARAALAPKSGGKPLQFNLVTHNSPPLLATANEIKRQLNAVGVEVNVKAVDLDTLQQDYIRPRQYDLLLFGQNIGAAEDVYNFWHSSQAADPGLNLSAYKNPVADRALESARLARDPANKRAKETAFLQAWDADTPAVILYSPYYLYGQNRVVTSTEEQILISPADRFYNIQTWAVKYRQVSKGSVR